jgi:hypothetical protein
MWQKITLVLVLFYCSASLFGQDVMTKMNGEKVNCTILLESEEALLVQLKSGGVKKKVQVLKKDIVDFTYEDGKRGSLNSITEDTGVSVNDLKNLVKKEEDGKVDLVEELYTNKFKNSKNLEVLFSPEYLSMRNMMFKVGDKSSISKFRIGWLYHSSTQRVGLLNQVAQFNVGLQIEQPIGEKALFFGAIDLVAFNAFDSYYVTIGGDNIVVKSHQYGPAVQVGLGFDVYLNDLIYLGFEGGVMVTDLSFITFRASNNTGLRLGIAF